MTSLLLDPESDAKIHRHSRGPKIPKFNFFILFVALLPKLDHPNCALRHTVKLLSSFSSRNSSCIWHFIMHDPEEKSLSCTCGSQNSPPAHCSASQVCVANCDTPNREALWIAQFSHFPGLTSSTALQAPNLLQYYNTIPLLTYMESLESSESFLIIYKELFLINCSNLLQHWQVLEILHICSLNSKFACMQKPSNTVIRSSHLPPLY